MYVVERAIEFAVRWVFGIHTGRRQFCPKLQLLRRRRKDRRPRRADQSPRVSRKRWDRVCDLVPTWSGFAQFVDRIIQSIQSNHWAIGEKATRLRSVLLSRRRCGTSFAIFQCLLATREFP